MKLKLIAFFLCLFDASFCSSQINVVLKNQLDSMMILDQKYRQMLSELSTKEKVDSVAKEYHLASKDVVNHFAKIQTEIDSSNLTFIEKIISDYGYPGKTLVGSETSEVAWFVLQHSNKIDTYLPLIKKAGKKGELKKRHVAMMEDRYLMYHGKEQRYGSQATCKTLTTDKFECFIYPIKNPTHVNRRRKKMGFETTVEENAKKMNIVYRVVRLSDIK